MEYNFFNKIFIIQADYLFTNSMINRGMNVNEKLHKNFA